jgi:hypothetical protein
MPPKKSGAIRHGAGKQGMGKAARDMLKKAGTIPTTPKKRGK